MTFVNPINFLSYQGASKGSPKRQRQREEPVALNNLDVEAAKPKPNISGPTLTSTTRNGTDLTLKRNPIGTSKPSNEPAKQDQPDLQPIIALKPLPKKSEKPVSEKEENTTKYSPPKLRNREWPPKDVKKASLNRVSSPTRISKPVEPVKPLRPKSHAGMLDKPSVPLPPSGRESVKPVKARRPESLAGIIDKRGPAKPLKPLRPESHAGVIDKPEPVKPVKPRRPESHAGILDKPTPPSWKRPVSQSSATDKNLEAANASNSPVNPTKVPGKPPLRPVDARFPRQSSEERPSSLPLKPSDLKKSGLAAGTKKPSSFSTADNKSKKVALKPPGVIPPRPGSKQTSV